MSGMRRLKDYIHYNPLKHGHVLNLFRTGADEGVCRPRNFTVGLGPVNFRFGGRVKLLHLEDNLYTLGANAIGLTNYSIGKIRGSKNTGVDWSWHSLSPNWRGGPLSSLYDFMLIDATGAHTMINTDRYRTYIWDEENTHIWQSRAMGELFFPSYIYSSGSAFLSGRDYYYGNWWEFQAQKHPF